LRADAALREPRHNGGVYATVMVPSELDAARARKALDAFKVRRRPPAHVRSQLDLGLRITGQSVEIFEIRPAWRGAPGETMEHAVANEYWWGQVLHRHVARPELKGAVDCARLQCIVPD
jgi:hypothetical protein